MDSPSSTPGSQALEAAKTMHKDLEIFKKPNGIIRRSKGRKSKVLDEDTYIERMSDIIQRDFFPHLEKLKAQNEYLDAEEQNDTKRMRELYVKYSSGRPATEREMSPATFETPQRNEVPEDSGISSRSFSSDVTSKSDKEKEIASRLGLDAYLGSHTSEDNASFEDIMAEAEKRHRLKFAWLYENEEKALAIESKKQELLAIEGTSKPRELDGWKYMNKNYIMYVPDGVELTVDEKIEMAKRRQEVVHDNTRLVINPFNEQQNQDTIGELAKTRSTIDSGKIGVDGKEVVKKPTPMIRGFSIVATPSPRPGECESPLMTWGQIEGTPFRLDGGDTPLVRSSQGPSFKMAEPPKREKLAMQLAEKASERLRDKKTKALETAWRSFASPSPRSTIDRLNTMSPAARRLATQKLKSLGTPSRTPRSTPRNSSMGIRTPNTPRTPRSGISAGAKTPDTRIESSVLTDNLLNLPQRQRAADFF